MTLKLINIDVLRHLTVKTLKRIIGEAKDSPKMTSQNCFRGWSMRNMALNMIETVSDQHRFLNTVFATKLSLALYNLNVDFKKSFQLRYEIIFWIALLNDFFRNGKNKRHIFCVLVSTNWANWALIADFLNYL